MKKVLLLPLVLLFSYCLYAQSYESIKNKLILNQFKPAKEDLDKAMANAKFTAKPEAYILKASIYAGLAMDPTVKSTPEAEQLRNDADAAFTKYKEMQPSLELLKDPIYQNGPLNLYSSYFSAGYGDYEKKKWADSYAKFKKVVDLSDMLIAQKIIGATTDTNSLILAGVTAENAAQDDAAAIYYKRLADLKIGGNGFEGVYHFLVNYSFKKKDMAGFEKYRETGKELYPKVDFFNFDKVDFAVGLEDDFNKKLVAVDEILANDPNNYRANLLLGGIIYDTLDSRKSDPVMPANYAELEGKMVKSLTKAGELKPESELPYLYLGDHFINKSKVVTDKREALAAEIKKRTKPGAPVSKEDAQKRDALEQEYGTALEGARVPYEKLVVIFGQKPAGSLTSVQKQQYKFAASYLADIATFRKEQSKGKPADIAKYTADEKKWNDLYDSIK